MSKYYGAVGYVHTVETAPGVWTEEITERKYYGDILRVSKRYDTGVSLNDDININNSVSIIADEFAFDNIFALRYICLRGVRWKINNVDVQPPRLILSIGGLYNGHEDRFTQ